MPGTHHSKARWLHLQHCRPPQTRQGPVELTPQFCGVFGCALMFAHRTLPRWMPDTTGLGHEGCWGTAWAPPWVGGADADGADADRTMAAGHKETVPGFSPTTTQGQRHREQGLALAQSPPLPYGATSQTQPCGDRNPKEPFWGHTRHDHPTPITSTPCSVCCPSWQPLPWGTWGAPKPRPVHLWGPYWGQSQPSLASPTLKCGASLDAHSPRSPQVWALPH